MSERYTKYYFDFLKNKDYLTVEDLINIKIKLTNISDLFEKNNENLQTLLNQSICIYGYVENPYMKAIHNIQKFEETIEKVLENMPEHVIFQHYKTEIITKKDEPKYLLKLNKDHFIYSNFIDRYLDFYQGMKEIENFDNVRKKHLKDILKIPKGKDYFERNNKIYIIDEVKDKVIYARIFDFGFYSQEISFVEITITMNDSHDRKVFKDILEKYFPQHFI